MDENKNIEQLAINTLKINGVATVQRANSGHPGIVLGSATIIHTLFTRHMIFNPSNPKWVNRDRFVLSAGHGSALLYSELFLLGLAKKTDLQNFRQVNSKTPGHPEYGFLDGVEATTGPLGQGIGMAVGMAIGEESLRARFPEINHYTYVLCGDGDLQEGVANEALSFAGFQKLNKLIILYDSNNIQLDTPVNKVFNENLQNKIEAMGFYYQLVKNNTIEEIDKAIINAKKSNKPSLIEIKTIIGDGSSQSNTSKVHGSPLSHEDFINLKNKLNWNFEEFSIPNQVSDFYKKTIIKRSQEAFQKFKMSSKLKTFLDAKPQTINLDIKPNLATRESSGEVIKYLNDKFLNWIGGSADLSSSTKAIGGDNNFMPDNRLGRNILFGVREFAMATIGNGLCLHSNFYPFVSSFFVFTDYLKPALRLSSMMKLGLTYIMTHDSFFVGEDGPTHEPIEQLAMVRSIPNINVVRPADEKEVIGAFELALNERNKPTVIVLTRQNIVSLPFTKSENVKQGAYYILKNNSKWTIVASGSELSKAFVIAKKCQINCISLVNANKAEIFWDRNYAITIEAATTYGMAKYGLYNIGIDTFGQSGPGENVAKYFNFDENGLLNQVQKIMKENHE